MLALCINQSGNISVKVSSMLMITDRPLLTLEALSQCVVSALQMSRKKTWEPAGHVEVTALALGRPTACRPVFLGAAE